MGGHNNGAASLAAHFSSIPDPRMDRTKAHELIDILVIAVCAAICGADTWVDVETFGQEKEDWLKRFLHLPNGIPSHDTFGRVFSLIDPEAFQHCFAAWVQSVVNVLPGQVIAIDGKTVRGSKTNQRKPLHMVNAWAVANHLVLGQRAVNGKSNEITAIPELLKLLELKGCIVTIDAMGTQGWIIKKIREQSANYVLTVKANQQRLLQDIKKTLVEKPATTSIEYHRTHEAVHGREEIRECWLTHDLARVRSIEKWTDLASVARITHTRTVNGQTTVETRHYITSLNVSAEAFLQTARSHWAIENQLHWTLDVAFREDASRVRIGHAPANFAVVRHIALNLLKQESSAAIGMKAKRLKAALSEVYLEKVLAI
jgi:predicted transposase YbfD/YdcC